MNLPGDSRPSDERSADNGAAPDDASARDGKAADQELSEDGQLGHDDRPEALEERLVAYLDGELEPGDAADLEEQLATDELLRGRLNELERTWDMLDDLPLPDTVGKQPTQEKFTRSTIAMVVAEAEQRSQQRRQAGNRRAPWIWASILFACLASSWAGYQVVYRTLDAPNRRLADDIPVIENMDAYRSAEDVVFLRRLAEEKLFDSELEGDSVSATR